MNKVDFNLDNRKKETRAGYSLLEVMISFTIFTFVMTGVVWMLISAQRLGESARNRANALQQARASLEQVISAGYTSTGWQVGSHSVSRGGLTGTYVVSEPAVNERKRITMSYSYPSFGRTATVDLQLEISNALH